MLDISNNNPIDPANPSIITPQITPFDITNTDPNFATGIDQLIVIPLPAPPPVPTTAPTLTPTAPPHQQHQQHQQHHHPHHHHQ